MALDENDLKAIRTLMEGLLGAQEQRFDQKLGGFEQRLDRRIDNVRLEMGGIEQRLTEKIDSVDARLTSFQDQATTNFDELFKRWETQGQENEVTRSQLGRIEEKVDSNTRRSEVLEQKVA